MSNPLPFQAAIFAMLNEIELPDNKREQLTAALTSCFPSESGQEFDKLADFDEIFDANPELEEYYDYLFDLLMVSFIMAASGENEDYFESEDWMDLEEECSERGTEGLNVLLYLLEAAETEAEISMDDFLDDFLLVDEDEFQDEHEIYREVILNRNLLDSEFSSMLEVLKASNEDSPLEYWYVPLFCMMYYPNDPAFALKQFKRFGEAFPNSAPVIAMAATFYQGILPMNARSN